MGKPVKKPVDQAAARPPKRQREVTPPSESSHDEEDDAQPIPAADIALLVHLRHEELHGAFRIHQSFGKKYRALFSQLLSQTSELVLQSVQPVVVETLKKAKFLPEEDDSALSFYHTVLVNASRIVRKKMQGALDMKLTTVALRNTQEEAGASGAPARVIPFGAEDLMPAPRFGVQSDTMFTRFLTSITVRCFADETAIEALPSPGNEAFHCLEYSFHFAPQESSRPFRNNTLRQRFFFQGGAMYRQAVPCFGRLIDVRVDTIDWKTDEGKAAFLSKSDHLGWFRAFFSGLLPPIGEEGDVVPPHHFLVRTILEKHLGTTAAIPSSELCAVDLEVLQRRFEGRGVTVPLPPFADYQNDEDSQDAAMKEDPVWLQNFVSGRVAKYFARIQALGTKGVASEAPLTEAEEWDVVRLVVLVNTALRGSATELLFLAATQPIAVAMAYPPGSDGADDDDDQAIDEEHGEEFDEGDEEEENDDEEDDEEDEELEAPPKQPQPPSRAPGKKPPQPDCKHQ